MKKFFSFVLAIVATTTMAFAESDVTVDCGKKVQISATPATGWDFVEWNDHNTENPRTIDPTADAHYVAIFAIKKYTIIFQNWDGTELQNETLEHGAAVSYKGETPTKPATAQYTYTFSGWSPNVVYTATDNATYTAQFNQTINKYTIIFKNWDGAVLESKDWEYGTTPTYEGTPTRPADDENTYTFKGWDVTPGPVTGTAVYTATYNNTTNTYDINVETEGEGGTVTGDGEYQYGKEVTLTATPEDCYEFDRWSDEPLGGPTVGASRTIIVEGDKTYKAIFKKIQYTITTAPDDAAHGSTAAVELQ